MEQFQRTRSKPSLPIHHGTRTCGISRMSTRPNQGFDKSPHKNVKEKPRTKPARTLATAPRQLNKEDVHQDSRQYYKEDNKTNEKDDKKHHLHNTLNESNLTTENVNEKPEPTISHSQTDHISGDGSAPDAPDKGILAESNANYKHAKHDGIGPTFLEEELTEGSLDQSLTQFETPETYVGTFDTPTQQSDSSLNEVESLTQDFVDDIDNNLPPTTALLTTKGGSKVYVVGTVHFSLESQEEVAKVIKAVQPNYLVLELCSARAYMLQWNEEQILKEAQNLNFKLMKQVIQTTGLVQGGLYLILLSVANQITKQLGIAPGGEFRRAFREAKDIPNCMIWFGDRPLQVTMQRMLSSLSVWQIIKLAFVVLFKEEKISKEEVEKCKDQDVLERMILGFSKELPEFAKVMVVERDIYLTYSLQLAAQKEEPNKVVGVVGIGHLAGIKENWGRVSVSQLQDILTIPPPKLSSRIMKFTLKFTAVGLVLYGVHRLASRSTFYSNLFSDQSYWNLSNMMFDIWDSPIIQT